MDTQKASSSSLRSHFHEMKYDVFLSFRGEDTRKSFTSHLHQALSQKGVYCFMDDEELQRGELISPAILDAIEKSKISIIVLSRNYATSKSCLDELVKTLECRKSKGQVVLPIFYDVDPSELRSERGRFGDAIRKVLEEKSFADKEIRAQKWRTSLIEVSNLSGWKLGDRYESKFIQKIVQDVLSKLKRTTLNVAKNPVGLDSQLNEMLSLLSTELNDVRMVGIYGIGGIGKTTLAKAVYNSIMDQFDCSSFVTNVREFSERKSGLVQLQERLLSQILVGSKKYPSKVNHVDEGVNLLRDRLCHKKALIVLDDVDQLDQLENLAGDCSWFGCGSRIIITTRDEHLLIAHGVENIYKVKELDKNSSLQLFSLNAFRKPFPVKEFEDLSLHVLNYAKGLPLALIVLGSSLCGRKIQEWKSTLSKLKRIPNKQIYETLKISFDGLEDHEKAIFLDIACFFKGEDKDRIVKIFDSCNFYAESGVSVLVDKSLVTIESNKVWMHDLLQEMGREIVRQESINEPGKRSRLWFCDDVLRVLEGNTGTEAIEGIKLDSPEQEVVLLDKAFTNMKNLRLLIVRNANISGSHLEFLSNVLILLDWPGYPFLSLPSSFGPNKLVAMDLSHSRIKHLMMGFKVYKNLKFVNLSFSESIEEIPDFSIIPNLESLVLDHCTSLIKVHSSIGALEKLVTLSLMQCLSLKSLPSLKLRSLQQLYLVGCSKLENFPNIIEKMERLEQVYLEGTALKQLPSSIENLFGLKLLYLDACKDLEALPSNIHRLQNLVHLGLSGCSKLRKVQEFPPSLVSFSAADCQSLETIPKFNVRDITRFSYYHLDLTNCKKLAKSQVDYLANMLSTTEAWIDAEIIYPGSEIPEWFSHHNTQGSRTISFEVPSNLYAKPLAWCFYVIFGPKEGRETEETGKFSCEVEIVINNETRILRAKLFQSIESDHVWIKTYLPIPLRWYWISTKRLWTSFDVSFTIHGVPREEATTQAILKKCGFHLLYKQDGHMTIPMMVRKNPNIIL